jgi:hypothetical protein
MYRIAVTLCSLSFASVAFGQFGGSARASDDTAAIAADMRVAASALLESVRGDPEFSERLRNYSMEDELLLPLDDPERLDWVYWPAERAGLSFDLMHTKHRALTHDLLWTLASPKGYHKLVNIMTLETVLQATSGTGFPRGIEDYTLTLFGEPSGDAPWSWRLEGHHISLTITVVPGQGVSVTPTFLGADFVSRKIQRVSSSIRCRRHKKRRRYWPVFRSTTQALATATTLTPRGIYWRAISCWTDPTGMPGKAHWRRTESHSPT